MASEKKLNINDSVRWITDREYDDVLNRCAVRHGFASFSEFMEKVQSGQIKPSQIDPDYMELWMLGKPEATNGKRRR